MQLPMYISTTPKKKRTLKLGYCYLAILVCCLFAQAHATPVWRTGKGQLLQPSQVRQKSSGFVVPKEPYRIFVAPAPKGDDRQDGTKATPLRTVAAAIRAAREHRRLQRFKDSAETAIEIILSDGIYTPDATLIFHTEESGDAGAPLLIRSSRPGGAVISGGRQITGWRLVNSEDAEAAGLPATALGHVYEATLPDNDGYFLNFRQLWVAGQKAIRAESGNGGGHGRPMQRILSWDHQDQSCWIPWQSNIDIRHLSGMEMLIHQWWAIAQLRVKTWHLQGDSMQLHFYQPESKLQSEHPWPAPWISDKTGNSAFYLTNAISFLDAPGEWYLDRPGQKIYYWPRKGEDLGKDKVTLPYLTTLVKVEGTIDQPVHDICFKDIGFQYSGWLRPSEKGHVPLQAGMYLLDAYKLQQPGTLEKKGLENQAWIGRPAAAVAVQYGDHIQFRGCTFEHLASTGLDLVKGTHDNLIQGNLFKDIGGTGIQVGIYADPAFETHLAYLPKNMAEVSTRDSLIDNLVTDVTNEDWGCVGISAGYVKDILIEHNEVSDVSYSGICVGWGWTKEKNAMSGNRILRNKVTHYGKRMYDVGGLYTLSAQPGSLIAENYIDSIYKAPYPHDPDHWFYFYLDEGSAYITLQDNWCPALKVMKNANGPGNIWRRNGPDADPAIKKAAGLEPRFQYMLKEKVRDPAWPVQDPKFIKANALLP